MSDYMIMGGFEHIMREYQTRKTFEWDGPTLFGHLAAEVPADFRHGMSLAFRLLSDQRGLAVALIAQKVRS